jgi:hypothetical protein
MIRKKALERWETKIGNFEVTPQAWYFVSLSPINLRHGPRTENTLRTPYPSNFSIVIEVCLRCPCIETEILLLLPAYSIRENALSDPLPSNGYTCWIDEKDVKLRSVSKYNEKVYSDMLMEMMFRTQQEFHGLITAVWVTEDSPCLYSQISMSVFLEKDSLGELMAP